MNRLNSLKFGISIGAVLFTLSCTEPRHTDYRVPAVSSGTLDYTHQYASEFVDPRSVSVWVPEETENGDEPLPILIMHDGLNLFDTGFSYTGDEWHVDETMTRLISESLIKPAIVVGIGNTAKRRREYQPNAIHGFIPETNRREIIKEHGGDPLGDAYLDFIVLELIPDLKRRYSINPDNIMIAGSSMGGAISLYAMIRYPDVFTKAACLSTHWPLRLAYNDSIIGNAFVNYALEHIPIGSEHAIYFDRGTHTLDAWYHSYQDRMDSGIHARNFPEANYKSLVFEGAEHNEQAWSQRLHEPLLFLLGTDAKRTQKAPTSATPLHPEAP